MPPEQARELRIIFIMLCNIHFNIVLHKRYSSFKEIAKVIKKSKDYVRLMIRKHHNMILRLYVRYHA